MHTAIKNEFAIIINPLEVPSPKKFLKKDVSKTLRLMNTRSSKVS